MKWLICDVMNRWGIIFFVVFVCCILMTGCVCCMLSEKQDLNAMGFDELMALNKPIKCEIDVRMNNYSFHSLVYFKGDRARVEVVESNKKAKLIEVFKDNASYIQLHLYPNQTMNNYQWLELCDWMKTSDEGIGFNSLMEYEQYLEDLKKKGVVTNYHCEFSNFGDEVFDTPGKICENTFFIMNNTVT